MSTAPYSSPSSLIRSRAASGALTATTTGGSDGGIGRSKPPGRDLSTRCGRRPDVRRCRRYRLEAHLLEDRPALVGRVDLEEVPAAVACEPAAVRDESTVDPAAAPVRKRRAAPDRPRPPVRG